MLILKNHLRAVLAATLNSCILHTTDIRGYDLGDQEVIDIQTFYVNLNVALAVLRLRKTRAPGRRGDVLILINPDPDWLMVNRSQL